MKSQHHFIPLDVTRIAEQLDLFEKKQVHMEILQSVDSTNDYLKTHNSNKQINICLAEQQTQGKGRLGRSWHSPFGENIYFSCDYSFHKKIHQLSGLSLVIGLAVFKTLKEFRLTKNLFVKWPNDVVWGKKKIAGTLIEVKSEKQRTCQVIVGIGINVNMLTAARKIAQPWTSMQQISQQPIDRNLVVAKLISYLIRYLKTFDEEGFTSFAKDWIKYDCLKRKKIKVKNSGEETIGKVIGIDSLGHLVIELSKGSLRIFSSGDTSLVK